MKNSLRIDILALPGVHQQPLHCLSGLMGNTLLALIFVAVYFSISWSWLSVALLLHCRFLDCILDLVFFYFPLILD